MIAGLIPAVAGAIDLESQRALCQRAELIERRAHALVEHALEHHEPWIRRLGRPPEEPHNRAAWLQVARTIAAYRDRYADPIEQPSGGAAEPSREDRAVAEQALRDAIALSRRSDNQTRRQPAPAPADQRARRL
jgi:hypothetical protein